MKVNVYRNAHAHVFHAINTGALSTPDLCEGCGANKSLRAHHDDYLKPLEVRWLCARCHKRHHSENGHAANRRERPDVMRITIDLDPDLHAAVYQALVDRLKTANRRVRFAEFVREALTEKLAKEGKKK